MKRLVCGIATIATIVTLAAQGGIAPLTADGLTEAIAYGQAHPDDAVAMASPVRLRMKGLDVRHHLVEAQAVLQRISEAPFEFFIASPFATAAMAAATASRKFEARPHLTVEALNARKVVIHVGPGSTFSTADAIENVVIKRDGAIIQPSQKAITLAPVQNALGASKPSANGDFTFEFEAFTPTTSITLVFIGAAGNYEWTVTPDELARLR